MGNELNIVLEYRCYDFDCLGTAVVITVNGENIAVCDPEDIIGILKEVLTHLRYNIKIETKYD